MRKVTLLLLLLVAASQAYTQDFSNKGKEFWIGYGNHVRMYQGNTQQMVLYITSDVTTTGIVEIPGLSWSTSFSVTANQISTINIPQSAVLSGEGLFNAGIHVVAQRPVVVYGHIFNSAVSGATLCLPVATLGREYYSVNYTQVSNEGNSFSYFFVVATEDNTTIEITPTATTLNGWSANTTQTITLNRGQIYQVLAQTDLTGSTIKSVTGAAGGCKRIAVFCGSGKISIGCPSPSSSDNLFQQIYPTSTWGKKYVTVASHNNGNGDHRNYYRIIKSTPSAIVNLDGSFIPAGSFTNGLYYTFNGSGTHVISSDEPILVAQYFTTQGCSGNPVPGDPEMIYLNPIEQTISNVTLFSSPFFQIDYHGLNIVVKNAGTALSSMKLDGASVGNLFSPVPNDPTYSYAKLPVGSGTHNLVSDSGFNAIAFGFGNAESYGYSAGTNLKDLYQFITVQNDYSTVNFPAGCKNTPLKFAITFPYEPTQIRWVFGAALNGLGLTDTVINTPTFDSTWIINGRTLYRYKLNRYSIIGTPGTYPVSIFATNPTITNGCSGEQEIQYDLQIFEQPSASFLYTHTGCLSDSVAFTDNSNGQGRPLVRWSWDFGDASTSSLRNPKHKYANAGTYTIRFSAITDIGCLSDTVPQTIQISNPPTANFAVSANTCVKSSVTFTDQSNPLGSTIVKWTWNFGDATAPVVNTNGNPVSHTYATAGTYNVTLQIETNTGCKSNVFTYPLIVHPTPKADFILPAGICLPQGTAQFTDQSTISDGTQSQFTYVWNFGDGNTSTVKNPVHNYSGTGPFNVKLEVTSNNGCKHDTTKALTTIFAQPDAEFTVTPEVCLGAATTFTDQSNGSGNNVTKWRWDFGDGKIDSVQNPVHTYATAGTYTVKLYIYTDKGCVSDTATHTTIVNPLPQADFSFSNPRCETFNITFTDGSLPNAGNLVKWNWTFGDGGTSSQQNPQHTYAASGIYNVSLDVETNKGCKSAITPKQVVVSPLPVPDFGMPGVCSNDAFAEFTDSSRIADGSENQFTYLWNFGDPNANAGNPNTSTSKNGRHRYTVPGVYTVRLTVTSKDGCSRFIDKQFTVNGSLPQAAFTINNQADLCSNKDVTITDASSVDVGKLIRVEIYWDYLNDPTRKTVDDNPATGKSYTFKYPEFGTPLTQTYQIRYVAYSGISCLNQFTTNITLKASPTIQFDAMSAVCEEIDPFQITDAREIFGLAGSGTFSGPAISSSGLFDPGSAKPGVHTIRYTFNASNGCSSFDEQTIQVNPTPVVDAGPDRTVLEGGVITLATKVTGNNLTYLWTPSIGLDNATIATPKVSPPDDTEYTLFVTSGQGCSASDKVIVKLLKQIKVPNAFTPNNDGVNDRWEILYLDSYPGCEVEVFNRYGQLVYRSIGYTRAWDGSYNGTILPVGTYYWIINPKNGRKAINGSVTIIR
ncbi:MAG TPA: PKD domain-containing protein [Chitinophagaceae bacterium]